MGGRLYRALRARATFPRDKERAFLICPRGDPGHRSPSKRVGVLGPPSDWGQNLATSEVFFRYLALSIGI